MDIKSTLHNHWNRSKPILFLFLMVAATTCYFMSRYTFALNGAISDCLNSKFFLVDTWDQDIKPGYLAAFYMEKPNELFKTGLKWIKLVAAEGGDTVTVTYDDVKVNDKLYKVNLWYTLSKLEKTMDDIIPEHVVPDGQFFMLGETPTSYDSRFWGTVEQKHIIGRAYAIF